LSIGGNYGHALRVDAGERVFGRRLKLRRPGRTPSITSSAWPEKTRVCRWSGPMVASCLCAAASSARMNPAFALHPTGIEARPALRQTSFDFHATARS